MPSKLEYHRFADPKLNTFSRHLKTRSEARLTSTFVDCLPLETIFKQHCPDMAIDFLSVDCEGLDFEVLTTIDFERRRPACICVEDFKLFQSIGRSEFHSDIADLLTSKNYTLFSQSIFSFLYVDSSILQQPQKSDAFDLVHSQVLVLGR